MKLSVLLIQLQMIAVLLLLSGFSYTSLGQQDSTKLSLLELKHTAQLLIELEGRRYEVNQFLDKERVYQSIIKGYQDGAELYQKEIDNLELTVEAVTPSWYDTFWVGAAVASLVVSSFYFLTR